MHLPVYSQTADNVKYWQDVSLQAEWKVFPISEKQFAITSGDTTDFSFAFED